MTTTRRTDDDRAPRWFGAVITVWVAFVLGSCGVGIWVAKAAVEWLGRH